MQKTCFAAALLLVLASGVSDTAVHAAVQAVRSAPFDFSQPKPVAEVPSFIKKILRWVDGGGDLHTKDPDPARRAPENTTKTMTVRFKFPF
jgi:hypothetical protein